MPSSDPMAFIYVFVAGAMAIIVTLSFAGVLALPLYAALAAFWLTACSWAFSRRMGDRQRKRLRRVSYLGVVGILAFALFAIRSRVF